MEGDEILLASRDEILGAASAVLAFNLNLAGFISRRKLPAISVLIDHKLLTELAYTPFVQPTRYWIL